VRYAFPLYWILNGLRQFDKLVAVYSSISKVIRAIVIRIMQSEVMNVVSFEFLELYPKLPYVPTIV
jgi:hypothetical protein